MDRTTAAGLWRFASDYEEAAWAAQKMKGERFFEPTYYLHGHSIELALKAFLRARGEAVERLASRKFFGHDLVKLSDEARRRQIGREVSLSKREWVAINLLSPLYAQKRFEYITTGSITVPHLAALRLINRRLVSDLKDFCVDGR